MKKLWVSILSGLLLVASPAIWAESDGGATQQQGSDINVEDAQAVASALGQDESSCVNSYSQANTCCTDPVKCSSGLSQQDQQQILKLLAMGAAAYAMVQSGDSGVAQSMPALCGMMSSLGSSGANVNTAFANKCTSTKNSCTQSCTQLVQKWTAVKTRCTSDTNCSSKQMIEQAISRMDAKKISCSGLSANAQAMNSNSSVLGNSAQLAQLCAAMSGLIPQDAQPTANTPVVGMLPTAAAVDCTATPENASCAQVVDPQGGGAFQGAAAGAGMIDAQGLDGGQQNAALGDYDSNPVSNPGVQQDSSGMGGLGAGGQETGDFGNGNANPVAAAGYSTDILKGERSGGYSSMGGSLKPTNTGGFSGYGAGDSTNDGGYTGLDLKQYLPGGAKDPTRKLAAAADPHPDIGSKYTDIFKRISDRFKIVCSMNRLRDCPK